MKLANCIPIYISITLFPQWNNQPPESPNQMMSWHHITRWHYDTVFVYRNVLFGVITNITYPFQDVVFVSTTRREITASGARRVGTVTRSPGRRMTVTSARAPTAASASRCWAEKSSASTAKKDTQVSAINMSLVNALNTPDWSLPLLHFCELGALYSEVVC